MTLVPLRISVSLTSILSLCSSHTNVISNCCFTKDGRYLCTASWDKTLQLWDVTTGTFRSQGGEGHNIGHDGCVSSCMFSDDGEASLCAGPLVLLCHDHGQEAGPQLK